MSQSLNRAVDCLPRLALFTYQYALELQSGCFLILILKHSLCVLNNSPLTTMSRAYIVPLSVSCLFIFLTMSLAGQF